MKILAAGVLTIIILIHSCFLKSGIFIQNVFGWIKIALVIFMVFTSLFAVLFRPNEGTMALPPPPKIDWDYLWEGSVWNWGIVSTALFKIFYSYAGLHNVNNVLNEVKNPVKTLRSAASAALLSACVLYVLVNIAYFLVVPIDDIKESGELIAALFFERVFGAHVGRVLLPMAVAISAAGNVMVVTFSHVRFLTTQPGDISDFILGSSYPGDCPARFSTLLANNLFLQALQCTNGCFGCSLHTFATRNSHSYFQRLLFYHRCRGLSRTILRHSQLIWIDLASFQTTRFA